MYSRLSHWDPKYPGGQTHCPVAASHVCPTLQSHVRAQFNPKNPDGQPRRIRSVIMSVLLPCSDEPSTLMRSFI